MQSLVQGAAKGEVEEKSINQQSKGKCVVIANSGKYWRQCADLCVTLV